MSDIIQYPIPEITAMRDTLKQGSPQLSTMASTLQTIAQTLEAGALQGQAGQAFTDGVRNNLVKAVTQLGAKFDELAQDLTKTLADAEALDAQTASTFS
jgi:uncharacterized protein YukE